MFKFREHRICIFRVPSKWTFKPAPANTSVSRLLSSQLPPLNPTTTCVRACVYASMCVGCLSVCLSVRLPACSQLQPNLKFCIAPAVFCFRCLPPELGLRSRPHLIYSYVPMYSYVQSYTFPTYYCSYNYGRNKRVKELAQNAT